MNNKQRRLCKRARYLEQQNKEKYGNLNNRERRMKKALDYKKEELLKLNKFTNKSVIYINAKS